MPSAYFEVTCVPDDSVFVIRLDDEAKIAHARAIITGEEPEAVHVSGTVVSETVDYNPMWPFHLEPKSIAFFAFAIEVCDASVTYVAEHLDEVGGSFLPGAHWCPWTSLIVREVQPE